MLKGIDIKEVVEFVSTQDVSGNPTKFLICNLSNRKKLSLFAGSMDKDGNMDMSKVQDKTFDILLAGLKAVKNLNGKDYEPVTEDVLDRLSLPVLTEVLNKILQFNFMSESEAKN